ncbi:MAG: DMT family transporter [Actinobacteria bacterium]|nr:DMT family transporter [Actinomycetota bacterium]MCL5445509.1 DMT family transporter [Actinomycetota bacterium]
MVLVVAASVGAAMLFGLGASFQRHGLVRAIPGGAFHIHFLGRVLKEPLWVIGTASGIAATALQLVALSRGSLIVVTPLLSTGLLIALGVDTVLTGVRLSPKAWLATSIVAVAIGAMVVSLGAVKSGPPVESALVTGSLVCAALSIAVWVLPGRSRQPPWWMAAISGADFAVATALAKSAITVPPRTNLDHLVVHALTSWEIYVALAFGIVGSVLLQHAFHAGPLAESLPTNTVVQPLVGVVIGIVAFHETFGEDLVHTVGAAVSLVVTLGALWMLARSLPPSQSPIETEIADAAERSDPTPSDPTPPSHDAVSH